MWLQKNETSQALDHYKHGVMWYNYIQIRDISIIIL